MTQFKHITALAIFLTSISGFAASDIAAGQEKAQTCVACHGVNGNSVVPTFPKLAGQHASYTLKQLKQFKSKERDNAIPGPSQASIPPNLHDIFTAYNEFND